MKLILIGGQSRSGKTEISKRLAAQLGNALILNLDDFYKEVEHAENHNFDEPAAVDEKRVQEAVSGLLRGEKVSVAKYDFVARCPQAKLTEIDPAGKEYLIADGIFSLTNELDLKKHATLTVYVDTRDDVAVARRFLTDQINHGRRVNAVFDQLFASVMPGRDQYIKPTKAYANVIVHNNTNDGIINLQPILDELAIKEEMMDLQEAAVNVANDVRLAAVGLWGSFATHAGQIRGNVQNVWQSLIEDVPASPEDFPRPQ